MRIGFLLVCFLALWMTECEKKHRHHKKTRSFHHPKSESKGKHHHAGKKKTGPKPQMPMMTSTLQPDQPPATQTVQPGKMVGQTMVTAPAGAAQATQVQQQQETQAKTTVAPVIVYASTTESEDSGSGAETETTKVFPVTTGGTPANAETGSTTTALPVPFGPSVTTVVPVQQPEPVQVPAETALPPAEEEAPETLLTTLAPADAVVTALSRSKDKSKSAQKTKKRLGWKKHKTPTGSHGKHSSKSSKKLRGD